MEQSNVSLPAAIGGYPVTGFLGRGGFSLVYSAKDDKGREVALKLGQTSGGGRYQERLPVVTDIRNPGAISKDEMPADAFFFRREGAKADFLDASEIDAMLVREAKILRGVRDPCLVRARSIIRHNERPVLVMDCARGKTLREKIRALEGIRMNWFLTVTRALQRLSQSGDFSYHGDLKPENIIISPSGSVALIDPASRKGKTGFIATTAHYNPFLLQSSKADVMAIGIILYEIVTGALPFDAAPWEYAGRRRGGAVARLSLSYFLSYQPPQNLNPNVPAGLTRIIYRCLVVDDYGLPELERDITEFLRT